MDDLVLDVTEFQSSHPGGKFLLEKNVGRDISKYFHGGYSFEPQSDSKDHKHSNYARTIVNSLIVARYVGKRDFACMQSTKKEALTDNVQGNNGPVQVFYMAMKGGIGTSKTRRMFYPDLDTVGRHYLVQEQDAQGYPTGNARQYTVATTMEPQLYAAYTSAFSNPASGTESLKKAIQASKDKTDEITLCIKNYHVGGLSNAIHTRHNISIFNVSGPMGRPLAVNLNGLNVAFVAGTGVLPLMDLVGFIAR